MKKVLVISIVLLFAGVVVALSVFVPWKLEDKDKEHDVDKSYEELGLDPNAELVLDIREQTEAEYRDSKRLEVSRYFEANPSLDEKTKTEMYNDIFWNRTGLSQEDINNVALTENIISGEIQVVLYFSDEGYEKLGEISNRNIGKNIGVFLDGELVSSPIVRETTNSQDSLIAGITSEKDAQALVGKIKKSLEKHQK